MSTDNACVFIKSYLENMTIVDGIVISLLYILMYIVLAVLINKLLYSLFESEPEFDEDEEFDDQFDEDSLPDIDVQIEPQSPAASASTEDKVEVTNIKEKKKNDEDSLVSTINYGIKVLNIEGGTLAGITNKEEEKCGDKDVQIESKTTTVPEHTKKGVEIANIKETEKNGEEN